MDHHDVLMSPVLDPIMRGTAWHGMIAHMAAGYYGGCFEHVQVCAEMVSRTGTSAL